MQLDLHDANEPNVLEPQHLPDTEVLAEAFRGCLQVCAMLSIKYRLDSLTLCDMLALWFRDAGGFCCNTCITVICHIQFGVLKYIQVQHAHI